MATGVSRAVRGTAVRWRRLLRRRRPRLARPGRWLRLLPSLLALLVSEAARAEPMAWQGTLALELPGVAAAAATITGVGVAELDADGAALIGLGVAGGIAGSATVPLSASATATAGSLVSVAVSASLGSMSLRPFHPVAPFGEPQLTRGTLPVSGAARLCVLVPGCGLGPVLPLSTGSGRTGVGVGGLLTGGGVGSIRFSVQASPWTLGWATVGLPTSEGGTITVARAGFVHGPWSFATGSTALPGAALQLVTPVEIVSNAGDVLPAFGALTLRFVPEPRSLLLLAPGVIGLFALARTRRR